MTRLARLLIAALLLHMTIATLAMRADDRTKQLVERLVQEAGAFANVAPDLIGQETLEQRAQKPSGGFHLRVGAAATRPPEPKWQQRTLISEYGFAAFSSESAPGTKTLHEIRQVTSVDGRKVKESSKASAELAKVIMAGNNVRKRELLKQFEKYGLLGAANDFGQLLLLFAPGSIERYEFTYKRAQQDGPVGVLIFSYKQIDGPNPLTVVDETNQKASNVSVEGEIWVDALDYSPRRITLASAQPNPFESLSTGLEVVRQEATVEYRKSTFGVVLPQSTDHKELHSGVAVAENHFTYSGFRRFTSSSAIVFPPATSDASK